VAEAAASGEAENADLRAVQKAKASPKLSPRGSPASDSGTVETQRLDHRRKAAQHQTQMRQILFSITRPIVSNYLTTDTHRPATPNGVGATSLASLTLAACRLLGSC
jgi:hypothetical protein